MSGMGAAGLGGGGGWGGTTWTLLPPPPVDPLRVMQCLLK